MSGRLLFLLFLSSLLIFSQFSPSLSAAKNDDSDEDLSFLEEDDDVVEPLHSKSGHSEDPDEFDDDALDDSFDGHSDFDESDSDFGYSSQPEIDEKDVVILKERNFSDVIENNQYVMVEFYAPWCGHCQALAPEYAAAATELKGKKVVLAKVDATEESELAHEYDVQGFPTVHFFVDGVHKPYPGQRTK